MTYEQAQKLLKEKDQTQLLRFYHELDDAGKQRLLAGIGKIDWKGAGYPPDRRYGA